MKKPSGDEIAIKRAVMLAWDLHAYGFRGRPPLDILPDPGLAEGFRERYEPGVWLNA